MINSNAGGQTFLPLKTVAAISFRTEYDSHEQSAHKSGTETPERRWQIQINRTKFLRNELILITTSIKK